jgi:hypothetical protein
MTPDRCLEVLRELRSLEWMAFGLRDFVRVSNSNAEHWPQVITAIDDKVRYLTAVLRLEADADTLAACEQHLAQEQQAAETVVRRVILESCTAVQDSRSTPRPTIH